MVIQSMTIEVYNDRTISTINKMSRLVHIGMIIGRARMVIFIKSEICGEHNLLIF